MFRQASRTIAIRAPGPGLHEFTDSVQDFVAASGISEGLLTLFCSHTSASLLIQENAAPAARRDLQVRAYAVASAEREKADEAAVELHYLQTGDVTRVTFDSSLLNKAKFQVMATADEISASWRHGYFPPRPSQWQCARCEYRVVCDEGVAALISG